uniref:Tail protein n=1 Tax=viral metagenome TaxID=1070528 RepID=A0A6M3JY80_9ZZZZ
MAEILELRQENSKTFSVEKGRQLIVSMGALHYKDNYASDEQWKDIDLTWEGNKITKAPYELTLEGNKVTIRDKKSGEISTIELLEIGGKTLPTQAWEHSKGLAKAFDTDLEIVAENSAVKFARILKSDKAPKEAKYKIVCSKPCRVRASDEDGDIPVESTLVDGVLTETLKPDRSIKYPVRIDPTWQVGASTDDCYLQKIDGSWAFYTNLAEITPGYTSATNLYKGGGMRFLNVTIPQGATINAANLIFTCYVAGSGTTVNTRITGNDVDDAATWSTLADFQARRGTVIGGANNNYITAAQVAWDAIGSWVLDTAYNSPEIKTVIQEIIDRVGWASGNDLALFWDDFDNRSSSFRRAYAYDGSTTKCPQLVITYIVVVAPTVTTQAVSSIATTTATGNGNITATGGENASAWGTCLATTANPTTADTVDAGSGAGGTGAFTTSIDSLATPAKYHVRAYATNTGGTGYGADVTFITTMTSSVLVGELAGASRAATYTRLSSVLSGIVAAATKSWNRTIASSVLVGIAVVASRAVTYTRASSVLVGVLIGASRTLSYTRASSVLSGIVVSASKSWNRTVTSSVLVGIAVAASKSWNRTISSAVIVGIVATATRAITYSRTSSVLVGVLASATRVVTFTRASSTIIGIVASATRALTATRTSPVIVGIVVSATRVWGRIITASVIIGVKVMGTMWARILRRLKTFTGRDISDPSAYRDLSDDNDEFRESK